MRRSGILLPVTALPGHFGVGEIGPEAHRWLDALHEMGQSYWQILPLGPSGVGNSPYSSSSTFAGDEFLISIGQLLRDGLLAPDEVNCFPSFPEAEVDYPAAREIRMAALRRGCVVFRHQIRQSPTLEAAFHDFCAREQAWLDDYTLFRALKGHFDGAPWDRWPVRFSRRDPATLAEVMAGLHEEIEEAKILQYLFESQWVRLRNHAAGLGIRIIGDLPIFVAHDSADVWAHPDLFHLDATGKPTVVAGVPPDYFSATGQRWGNPLYNWERHARTGFAWWKARMRRTLDQVDRVRIDHFRAFAAHWEIPAHEPTAIHGSWVEGPGTTFFDALAEAVPADPETGRLPIIAEDLGLITDDVHRLRDHFGFPGMRVLQFGFGPDGPGGDHLPENFPPNCVAYTGTHDNDTVLGMYHSTPDTRGVSYTAAELDALRHGIREYFSTDARELHWTFVGSVMHSRAETAVVPLQDLLGLGSEARMNTPGLAEHNWRWRFNWNQLTPAIKRRFADLTAATGRAAG